MHRQGMEKDTELPRFLRAPLFLNLQVFINLKLSQPGPFWGLMEVSVQRHDWSLVIGHW